MDYMYANISEFAQGYSKSGKSFEEVCMDYTYLSTKFLSVFVVTNGREQTEVVKAECPSISKSMYFNELKELPPEALIECFGKIL
jgi:hypothetical protein